MILTNKLLPCSQPMVKWWTTGLHLLSWCTHPASLLRLLLPGGDVDLEKSQFSRAAGIFYTLAVKVRGPVERQQTNWRSHGKFWHWSQFWRFWWLLKPDHPPCILVLQANDAGDYFPIWGTCQGFQQLSLLTAKKNLLTLTDTRAVALPLNFTSGTNTAGPGREDQDTWTLLAPQAILLSGDKYTYVKRHNLRSWFSA